MDEREALDKLQSLVPVVKKGELSARQEAVRIIDELREFSRQVGNYAKWILVATWDVVDRMELWKDMGYSSTIEYARATVMETGGWGFQRGRKMIPSDRVIMDHIRVFRFWKHNVGLSIQDMARYGYFRLLNAMPYARLFMQDGKVHPLLMDVLNDFEIPDASVAANFLVELSRSEKLLGELTPQQRALVGKSIRLRVKKDLPSVDERIIEGEINLKPLYVIDAASGIFTMWSKKGRNIVTVELGRFNMRGEVSPEVKSFVRHLQERGIEVQVVEGDDLVNEVYDFFIRADISV